MIVGQPNPVLWGPNRIDVFALETDRAVWHDARNRSAWSGWQSLGGVLGSTPCPVSWGANRLEIAKGTDDALYHYYWTGAARGGWEDLGGVIAASDDPAAPAPDGTVGPGPQYGYFL